MSWCCSKDDVVSKFPHGPTPRPDRKYIKVANEDDGDETETKEVPLTPLRVSKNPPPPVPSSPNLNAVRSPNVVREDRNTLSDSWAQTVRKL